MGMDISGKNPTAEVGEYFRNNVWWWRPLAIYIEDVAPALYAKNPYWHSNDGGGLNAKDSIKLADLLEAEIEAGRTATWKQRYDAHLASLPRETCSLCEGTGVRRDKIGIEMGMPERVVDSPEGNPRIGETGWCNGCSGWGSREDWQTSYPFSVENVKEFAEFLRASGGFEIW